MASEPIPATKDRLGEYDAIASAKPGEGLFPLQFGDPFAPPTVLHWAGLCREAGLAEPDEKKSQRLLRKATEAEYIAWQMMSYQRGEAAVEGKRASYNDIEVQEEDEAKTIRRTRIRGAERLHSILAQASEVADALGRLHTCPEEEVMVREAIAQLRSAAFAIEPRRGMERS